jgi:hypothetical protein
VILDGQLLSPMTPDQLEASRFFLERLAGQSFMVVQECEDDRRKLWQHLACNPQKPA